jgi:hypothetical protein
MEVRSRVAAAAAAVVPFHCVICFDEFNLKDRPPMVLPCGHTYVCLPCSKRLRRCMECREPLFLLPTHSNPHANKASFTPGRGDPHSRYNTNNNTNNTNNNRRYGAGSPQPPSTPPHGNYVHSPPATIALPIPKNVVLISIIEAAERQAKLLQSERREWREDASSGTDSSDDTATSSEDDDEDQFDLNRIISGMATLSGPCGTYAVRESTGLAVVASHPRITTPCGATVSAARKPTDATAEPPPHDPGRTVVMEPFALDEGQTVQVVEFEDGVAKLARGAGYIVANSSQLVKGTTIDIGAMPAWLTSKSQGDDISLTLYLMCVCLLLFRFLLQWEGLLTLLVVSKGCWIQWRGGAATCSENSRRVTPLKKICDTKYNWRCKLNRPTQSSQRPRDPSIPLYPRARMI